jgi:hypothetical protein
MTQEGTDNKEVHTNTHPEVVRIYACRNNKKHRDRWSDVVFSDGQLKQAPSDIVKSWAKTGCQMCSGSGEAHIIVRSENGDRRVTRLCSCVMPRLKKAHPELSSKAGTPKPEIDKDMVDAEVRALKRDGLI